MPTVAPSAALGLKATGRIVSATVSPSNQPAPPSPGHLRRRLQPTFWGLWFAGLSLLYALTAQRGAAWQDSGVYQLRSLACDLLGAHGGACAHPLYILLSHLATRLFGLFGCALVSALPMALAATLLGIILEQLGKPRRTATLASLLFASAHLPWWLATIPESYPLWLGLFAVQTLAAAQGRWPLAWFLAGISLGVHNLTLLTLPALLLAAPRSAPFLLPGALPLYLFARANAIPLGDLLVGSYGSQVCGLIPQNTTLWIANLALFSLSLANPLWLAILRPRLRPRSNPFDRYLLAALAFTSLFFVRYGVSDQFMFGLPTLWILALLAGLGMPTFDRLRLLPHALVLTLAVAIPLSALAILDGHLRRPRHLPFRNEARYWLLPWKHDEASAETFARSLGVPDHPLYADTTAAPVLALHRIPHIAPGDPRWRQPPAAPVLILSPIPGYAPDWLFEHPFRLEKHGEVTLCSPIEP